MAYHSEPLTTRLVLAFCKNTQEPEIYNVVAKGAGVSAIRLERSAFFTFGSALFLNTAGVLWIVMLIATVLSAQIIPQLAPVVAVILTIATTVFFLLYLNFSRRKNTHDSPPAVKMAFSRKDLARVVSGGAVTGSICGFLLSGFCLFIETTVHTSNNDFALGILGIAILGMAVACFIIASSANPDKPDISVSALTWRIDEEDVAAWKASWRKVYFAVFSLWLAYLLLVGKLTHPDITTGLFWLCVIPLVLLIVKSIRYGTLLFSTRLGQTDKQHFLFFQIPLICLVSTMAIKLFFFWLL